MSSYRTAIGLLQRNKQAAGAAVGVFFILVLLLSHPFSFRTGGGGPYFETEEDANFDTSRLKISKVKQPHSRLIAGVDGFYVFENVYVKDATLYVVPHPSEPPLPSLNKIVTSVIHENYTSDPESFASAPHEALTRDGGNGDYPQVPRLRVLTAEEAYGQIPGWGDLTNYKKMNGQSWSGKKLAKGKSREIEVFDGTTLYLADDPAITGWGSLMHHYYHWMGEILLGAYHAYTSSMVAPTLEPLLEPYMKERKRAIANRDPARKNKRLFDAVDEGGLYMLGRPPRKPDDDTPEDEGEEIAPPPRNYAFRDEHEEWYNSAKLPKVKWVISPWCVNWEGKELNEMVLFKGWGEPTTFRRPQWREMQKDRKWRMFERAIVVDRHAAHNDYWSQVSIWNKMALNILAQPLPSARPNFFLEPQVRLAQSLNFPSVPLQREGSRAQPKSLSEKVVKILYVDRQGSDRKLTVESQEGLMQVLQVLADDGYTEGEEHVEVLVEVVKFEHMNPVEQIRAAYDADIVIGIHGNGLTHIVWTRPGATIIEAFPVSAFLRDYEVVSGTLGHKYHALWYDREFTHDEWKDKHGNPEAGKLHDGTETQLDRDFIERFLRNAVREKMWST